jgi:hypothetical protein
VSEVLEELSSRLLLLSFVELILPVDSSSVRPIDRAFLNNLLTLSIVGFSVEEGQRELLCGTK